MNVQVITLSLRDRKKHSIRFDAMDKDSNVTALYIKNSAFSDGKVPNQIVLTIEEAK